MGLLSDLGSCGLSGTNSPDWLVRNNDLGPVVTQLTDSIELSSVHVVGSSRFSLLEELTNACKDGQTCINSDLGLFGNILVGLTVQGSSLGVTSKGVGNTCINDHVRGELTSVGTVSSK